MSPQKPVRRASERNDPAIDQWLTKDYPAVVREAKRSGATMYWADAMGLRSDHVAGTSFALRGETPIVRATGQRFGCNMISAITNQGHLLFQVFQGKCNAPQFIVFLTRLLRQTNGRIYVIVDGHPVHKALVVRDFVAAQQGQLRLIRMPGYCPELNPDELLNQDVKTNGLGKNRPRTRAEMISGVRQHLYRRQKQPKIIRNLFQEKHVKYAA